MAFTAGGARSRAGTGPPGRGPSPVGDKPARLRFVEAPQVAIGGGDNAALPRFVEASWQAAVIRGGSRQGKAWQEDTPRPEQRTGAVCPHATASRATGVWQSAGVA